MTEKEFLEQQIKTLSQQGAELNAGSAQRQDEIRNLQNRISTMKEEILRNQGAAAYGQLLIEQARKRIQEIDAPSLTLTPAK